MKNNIVLVLVLVVVGILAGFALLFGIGNAVQVATAPLVEKLRETSAQQKALERKVDQLNTRADELKALFAQAAKRAGAPQPTPPPLEDPNKIYNIPVGASVVIGKKDAPVTIVEFTDMQCPFCARFFPAVEQTLKAYDGKVRLVLKHFPLQFHPNARPAAKMALAANEQGKYLEMIKTLLDNGGDVSEARVKAYAKNIGLNYGKLMADLKANDAAYEEQIKADTNLTASLNVMGTPTFFINGKKTMAREFPAYKTEIDKILGQK